MAGDLSLLQNVQSGWGMMLTTHHHVILRLRIVELYVYFLYIPSWHGQGHCYLYHDLVSK